jgi:hypothetical protein
LGALSARDSSEVAWVGWGIDRMRRIYRPVVGFVLLACFSGIAGAEESQSPTISNEDVIASIKSYWRLQAARAAEKELQTAETQNRQIDTMRFDDFFGDCRGKYVNPDHSGQFHIFYPNNSPLDKKEMEACIAEHRAALHKPKIAEIQRIKVRIQEIPQASYGDDFVFTVANKTNYEGNYVSFVNARKKGTDLTYQIKVLLQFQQATWVVTSYEEKRTQ